MCNGESNRISHGGVVAFLRSPTAPTPSPESLSLHLAADGAHGGTLATLRGFSSIGTHNQVVIQ